MAVLSYGAIWLRLLRPTGWTRRPRNAAALLFYSPTNAHSWHRHALHADWPTPAHVKSDFGNASILKDGRVVFNIAGNKYRLVVWINYQYRVVYIRYIGTHAQYDNIDAKTI